MGPRGGYGGGTVLVRDHGTRGPLGRAVFRLHGECASTRFRGTDDAGGGTGRRGPSSGLPGAAAPSVRGGPGPPSGSPRGPRGGSRQRLLRPDRLAAVRLPAAPALGELGHQQQPASALVVGVGAAQMR